MKKRPEREQARALYREGRTYHEIVEMIGAAKSTVSLWCGDLAAAKRVAKPRREKKPPRARVAVAAEAPFEGYSLYEYLGQDGFYSVQLINHALGRRLGMARARYRMAVHLGRVIAKGEVVARRNRNEPHNDEIDNLVLTTYGRMTVDSGNTLRRICVMCDEEFTPKRNTVETCSKPCKNALVSAIITERHRLIREG